MKFCSCHHRPQPPVQLLLSNGAQFPMSMLLIIPKNPLILLIDNSRIVLATVGLLN
jgi:hypothetical protein